MRFLGLIIDAAQLAFWVPEDKLQRFLAGARAVLAQSSATPRELARVAGQLLSFTPAVDMAPLLARGLFHLLKGRAGWDDGFETGEDLRATLRWCVEAVPLYNGTRMIKRGAALQLQLAGDASEVRRPALHTLGARQGTPHAVMPYPSCPPLACPIEIIAGKSRCSGRGPQSSIVCWPPCPGPNAPRKRSPPAGGHRCLHPQWRARGSWLGAHDRLQLDH